MRWPDRSQTVNPQTHKDVDATQQASDAFGRFVDANAVVLDNVVKITGIGSLGAGIIGAGAAAANSLFSDGILTLPSIPDGGIFGN